MGVYIMATIRKDFDSYKIWYYSAHSYEAIIYLYQEGSYVGRIVFYRNNVSLPPNRNSASGPSIHYPVSRFNDIISILRYEEPLYLFLNLNNLVGIIATEEQEPIGEEEE